MRDTLLLSVFLSASTLACSSDEPGPAEVADTDIVADSVADTATETMVDTAVKTDATDAADAAPDATPDTIAEAAVDTADAAPESVVPTTTGSGASGLIPGVTTDLGVADGSRKFRALVGLPWRDETALDATLTSLYDPASASFRKYLTASAFMTAHAPTTADVTKVTDWLTSQGLVVARVSTNRLFLEVTGSVADFNKAFVTTLHVLERENPQVGNPPIEVLGVIGDLTVPKFVADRIVGVITADTPADPGPLPGETGSVTTTPPSPLTDGLTPQNLAKAYGLDTLATKGFTGSGVKLGLVIGATFKKIDLQSFWQSMGITRADPTIVVTMEPIATRYVEGTLDTQWSGALAKDAEVTVYEGPDSRNTSMIYTFNEAIGQAKVSVISDSFAHREDSEPALVGGSYDRAAKMAAALGITIVAASGDSGNADIPSVSPYVTAVGGTTLTFPSGVPSERAWSMSGSGDSLRFPKPLWQSALSIGSKRAVVDVAVNAGSPYWVYYLGEWKRYLGTSFASPVFAAGVAVMNGYRASKALPPIGWLNPVLYRTAAVQAAFRDV
ncbi:MAG: S53 family serine peptidase, partial [Polyangiales bacterium]